jgi:hypothetical protein
MIFFLPPLPKYAPWYLRSLLLALLLNVLLPSVQAQAPIQKEPPHSIQSDTLLQALERALFPPDVIWIPIKEYPDCWHFHMTMDTSILVRMPQASSIEVGKILRQIALTRDYRYFEPLMEMYNRHQAYFKKEWEDVRRHNKYGCNEKDRQISIMLNFENTLQALEFAHQQTSAEEIWAHYAKKRDLDFRIWRRIDLYWENVQAYSYYSEYFREVRAMLSSWFAYPTYVYEYSPFINLIEPFIIAECTAFDPKNYGGNSRDTLKLRNAMYFSRNLNTMSEVFSPAFEECLIDHFDVFIVTGRSVAELLQFAQKNKQISQRYVHFMLDQIFFHEGYAALSYRDKENWYSVMLDTHTRPYIKPYLLEKTESTLPEVRALAYTMLIRFPEEDVLDLFLSRARSPYISEDELKVLYSNFQRINQGKYFSEARHEEVGQQIKRMAPNYEKNER